MTRAEYYELLRVYATLRSIRAEIGALYDTYQSPNLDTPRTGKPVRADPVSEAVHKISRLRETEKKYIARLLEYESIIENIPSIRLQCIIRYRMLGYSWRKTALMMNDHPEAVRKTLERYLNSQMPEPYTH